jgi:hypothetical protein
MTNELVMYVRNRKRQKIGVVIAVSVPVPDNAPHHIVKLGWSLCRQRSRTNPGDEFDKVFGVNKARGRAIQCGIGKRPHSVQKLIPQMVQQAQKYFQGQMIVF